MRQLVVGRVASAVVASVLASACGPAEGIEVQDLPPMERPSMEARAGLAEIAGGWNLTGWVVQAPDIGEAVPEATYNTLAIQEQRIDSLAGYVTGPGRSRQFSGELRRDGIISLVLETEEGAAAPGVLAGIVRPDTIWLELSTVAAFPVPAGARAAFVRETGGQTWVRLPSGALLRDTIVAPAEVPVADAPEPPQPPPPAATTPAQTPPQPAPARPPAAAPEPRPQPQPQPESPPQPQRQPEPETEPEAEPEAGEPAGGGEVETGPTPTLPETTGD